MKTKLFEALKTKFEGVSEQTLNRIAEKAAKTVTEDDAVQPYVDGVTFQNVIDSEADYRATKGSLTAIENYEKKFNIKDGKPNQPPKKDDKTDDDKKDEDTPEWAKKILEFANSYEEDKKQNLVVSKKNQIVSKIIELGASKKDEAHIKSLVEMAGVADTDDVEEKSNAILSVYNAFKKPNGGTPPPEDTDEGGDDKAFDKLLESAKQEV